MRSPWLILSLAALALTACGEADDVSAEELVRNDIAAIQNDVAELPAEAEPPADAVDEAAPPAPKAEPAAWSASGYRLIGTEPFWGGTVSADEIVYSTPDNQAGEEIAVTFRQGQGREVYSGRLGGQPFVLTLTAGPCSDGMSDNVHDFTATLEVNGETRRGCANPRR